MQMAHCNTHFLTNIADECRTYPTLQRGEQLHQYTKYTLIIITSYHVASSSSSSMLQMYCTRPNFNFPFPRKPISMPRKFRSFPRATTRIGKYPSILSKTLVTTDILTCDRMLSLTYHLMVHCLPLMILLVTHLSYGLSLKPSLRRISVYKVYNNNVDSIIPYNAARMSTYKTFF